MQKPTPHKTQLIAVGIIALLVIASIAALLLRRAEPSEQMAAVISINGADLSTIDLSRRRDPYEIALSETAGIDMVLEVNNHAIRVLHSSCPDQVCVKSGWLSRDMDIAICMPNRVSVVVSPLAELATLRAGQP